VHVLFVCTGNICRSPTAERLALAYSQQHGIPDFGASSAGVQAAIGQPIEPTAAAVLGELGGKTSNFAARQITAGISMKAGLVLTMTKAHRDVVLELAPGQLRCTFTLAEASLLVTRLGVSRLTDLARCRSQLTADDVLDIPDPIGRGYALNMAIGRRIADLLPPLLELCR
jgi:protein-tyrosine phosphatase